MKNIDELLKKWYHAMQEYEKIMARPDLTKEEKKKLVTESGAISTKKDEQFGLYLNIIECYDTILKGKWSKMEQDLAVFKATGRCSSWGPDLLETDAESIWQASTDFETFYTAVDSKFTGKYDKNLLKIFYDINNLLNATIWTQRIAGSKKDVHNLNSLERQVEDFTVDRGINFIFHDIASSNYFGKAYLSVVPEKYTEVVLEIINFVNNFRHNFNGELLGQTKFRTVPANDAIVFRFTSPEQYFYIKDFVKNNKTIQKAIKPNATFVPTDDANLNVLPDDSGSYNCFLQTVIFSYLKACLNINKEPNVNEFTSFVEQLDINSYYDGVNNQKNVGYFKKTLLGKLYGEDDIKMIEESLGIGNNGRKLTKDTK